MPLEEWPHEAATYAIEDARRTLQLFQAQAQDDSPVVDRETGVVRNEAEQVAAAWGLHLAGVWGIRTDPVAVARLGRELDAQSAAFSAPLKAHGILRADGSFSNNEQ